jgi:hypothetical protein
LPGNPAGTAATVAPRWRLAGIFLLCLVVYNANLRTIASFDSLAASLLPFQLVRGGGLTLDHYGSLPHEIGYSLIQARDGHWVSVYPLFTPLLVTPLYLPTLAAVHLRHGEPPRERERQGMEKLAASSVAALSVLVLYLTLRRVAREATALWLALAYAFATSTWMISSQGLWQHGPGELLVACALYLLLEPRPQGWHAALLGLACGAIVANRPNDVFYAAAIAWIALRRSGRAAWPLLATGGGVALLLVAYNEHVFGNLVGGYGRIRLAGGEHVMEVAHWPHLQEFAALLVSNRGLFVFSPFLLALVAVRGSRLAGAAAERWALGAACLATALFYSCFPGSDGGTCYGPRYLTDGLPILFVLLADAWERLGRPARALFATGVAFAVGLQAIGAFAFPAGYTTAQENGLWNLTRSLPALALRNGPVSPQYLSILAPALTVTAPLAPAQTLGETRWREPPAVTWQAGSTRRLALAVANRSPARWSSLGGIHGFFAVRLLVEWEPAGGAAAAAPAAGAAPPSDYWLAWRLLPGGTCERRIRVDAPRQPGRYRLVVQPAQFLGDSWHRFAVDGAAPAVWPVEVVAADRLPGPREPPLTAASGRVEPGAAAKPAGGSSRSGGASP